jgi:hypothetical protein
MSLRVVRDRVVLALYFQIFLTAIMYAAMTYVQCDDECLALLLASRPSPVLPDIGVCKETPVFHDPSSSDPYAALNASLDLVARYLGAAYIQCGGLLIWTLIVNSAQWIRFEYLHDVAFMIMDSKKDQFMIYCCVTLYTWLTCVCECIKAMYAEPRKVETPIADPPVIEEPTCPRSPSTSTSQAVSSEEAR